MKRVWAVLIIIILALQFISLPALCETEAADSSKTPALKAEAAVLMDQETGKVLYEKEPHKRMYPASLTKVLTALLVIENMNLEETITVGKEINRVGKDSSGAGLNVGEKLSAGELVWALMLPSGNDASYTAAVTVARKKSGNASMEIQEAIKYFIDLMDKRALEIGAKESNFTNPDGYPDDNHYSTAFDMALVAREAMKNDFFREVVKTYAYTLKEDEASQTASKGKKAPAEWTNKNLLINPDSKYYYQYATGIKTGSTSAAGYCLAASATRNDMSLVSIVMKDVKEEARWADSKALFEYGFENFKYYEILRKGVPVGSIEAVRKYLGDTVKIDALAGQDYTDILSAQDYKSLKQEIEWDAGLVLPAKDGKTEVRLSGPIKSGQAIGKVTYSLNGSILSESPLIADKDSNKGDFTDIIYTILDQGFTHMYIAIPVIIVLLIAIVFIAWRRGMSRRRTES
jgi:D-alanyl-D-alanine carboxypeptidase (penicillin-binding protein 5/6)